MCVYIYIYIIYIYIYISYLYIYIYIYMHVFTQHHSIPYHTISYHIVSYRIIPHHIIPYHIIPYRTISYRATLCFGLLSTLRLAIRNPKILPERVFGGERLMQCFAGDDRQQEDRCAQRLLPSGKQT